MTTTTTTATDLVTLQLTPEQAETVYLALQQANSRCRDHQAHYLGLHENPKVGPVFRAEAWQTFRTWERHENTTAGLLQALQAAGVQPSYVSWGRFA